MRWHKHTGLKYPEEVESAMSEQEIADAEALFAELAEPAG